MEALSDEALCLSDAEARVLGCLIEKELATPEYYPLTLNSLLAACNQKTNRDPVVSYDEDIVAEAIEGLREKGLAMRVDQSGSRVPKYRHAAASKFKLERPEVALLALLLLRGPQTSGELRQRAERLYGFGTVQEVFDLLSEWMERTDPALVTILPVQPGKKERRFAQRLTGEPVVAAQPANPVPTEAAVLRVQEERARREALEQEVADLKARLDEQAAKVRHLEETVGGMSATIADLRSLLE